MAEAEDTAGLQALKQQQFAFAAHIRDPENVPAPADIEDRRMTIYRNLFLNNVTNFLKVTFPVAAEILGAARWRLLIKDYYRDHISDAPLFPDLPQEFLQYLAEERATMRHSDPEADPPFLFELAHYEWVGVGLRLTADVAPDPDLNPAGDLLNDRPMTSPLAWLSTYQFPVDKINKDFQPQQPDEQANHYMAVRNHENKVSVIKLNLVSARLFELLRDQPDRTGKEHLLAIAAELNHPDPDAIVANGLSIMQRWLEKAVLLGTLTTR